MSPELWDKKAIKKIENRNIKHLQKVDSNLSSHNKKLITHNSRPITKTKKFEYDILTLLLMVVVIVFFFILNPDGFVKAISPAPKLDLPEVQSQDNSISKIDLAELVKNTETFSSIPVQTKQRVAPGGSYLIMGDSMMQWGIGSEIENTIISSDASYVFRQGIQSTGLLHPERLDWYNEVDVLLSQHSYDVVIIMFGLNDADHMFDENGEYQLYGSDEWKVAYAKKVDAMLYKLLVEHKVKKVLWVGQPKMSSAQWDSVAKTFNDIYSSVMARYINGVFVDIYDRFAVNGEYSAVIADDSGVSQVARQGDGVHMNLFGGKIIAKEVFKAMQENEININVR